MKTILCLFVLIVSGATASVTLASNGGVDHKTSICHRTSSEKNPWVLITPDDASLPAHFDHGDVLPRGDQCPDSPDGWPVDGPL
jgi:hypothetical protein